MNSTAGEYCFPIVIGDIGATLQYVVDNGFITPVAVVISGQSASLLDDADYFSPAQLKTWQSQAEAHHRRVTFAPDPADPDCFREPGRSTARCIASYFDHADADARARRLAA